MIVCHHPGVGSCWAPIDPPSDLCMIPSLKNSPIHSARTWPAEILVADDVEEITELMSHWLQRQGHKVTRVSSGREVIAHVRAQAFDLLITDIVMPDGDGWEAILAAGRLRPEMRIVAISGGGKQMPVDACLRMAKGVGADCVLKKPFRQREFLAAVNRLLAR